MGDYDVFASFEKQCRAKGIHIPILPGIMPLNAYGGFKRMTGFCKTRIPPDMMLELDRLKGDDCKEAFIEFGVQWVTNMFQKIVASGSTPGCTSTASTRASAPTRSWSASAT